MVCPGLAMVCLHIINCNATLSLLRIHTVLCNPFMRRLQKIQCAMNMSGQCLACRVQLVGRRRVCLSRKQLLQGYIYTLVALVYIDCLECVAMGLMVPASTSSLMAARAKLPLICTNNAALVMGATNVVPVWA